MSFNETADLFVMRRSALIMGCLPDRVYMARSMPTAKQIRVYYPNLQYHWDFEKHAKVESQLRQLITVSGPNQIASGNHVVALVVDTEDPDAIPAFMLENLASTVIHRPACQQLIRQVIENSPHPKRETSLFFQGIPWSSYQTEPFDPFEL